MASSKNYIPSARRTTLRPFQEGIYKQVPTDFFGGIFVFGLFITCMLSKDCVDRSLDDGSIMDFIVVLISIENNAMSAIENTSDKRAVRIDFAPMVDLGFLLITFFIFTTSLLEPKAFGLHVPDETATPVPNQAPESSTITLQMKNDGLIDYYEGFEHKPIQEGQLSLYKQNSLRLHLMDKRKRILRQLGTDSNYTVRIEPSATTTYKEVIDVLDEMKILDIGKFVLVDGKQ